MGSDFELEDDFNIKCEFCRIVLFFVFFKIDFENKENFIIFLLRLFRFEVE